MTVTVDFETSPLRALREQVALAITDATGLTCHPDWSQAFTGPCVQLDGAGWTQITGCKIAYKVRVTVIGGNQAGTSLPAVQELTRQVFEALAEEGLPVEEIPPPGEISQGDRTYVACQFTVVIPLEPRS